MRCLHAPRLCLAFVALLVSAGSAAFAQQATVTGRITSAEGDQPVSDARIYVLGTSIYTVSNVDGRYTVRNVPAGTAEIRVIRVGFTEQKKPVRVIAGQTATLDFAMAQAIVQLEEVVTTATGQQRRTELGNSVTNLDANKILANSPVMQVGDLLVAKAPGVQVLPSNMTGAGSRVRVRGTASLSLSNDPIYIIDGIRMTSNSGGSADVSISVGGTAPSRVNDLSPEEIENIEIVKGPSAATLYGTAAANGVIVITTKRGRAGAPKWSVFAEGGSVQDKNQYPGMYALLGKSPGSTTQRKCLLKELSKAASANGATCLLDSAVSLNVFNDPDVSPIKSGWRNEYGAQVSGGTDAVRYFTSGSFENEIGPLALPPAAKRELDNFFKVPILGEWIRPEALQKTSVRTNLSASISPTLDISAQGGFIKLDQRLPQVDNNVNSFWYNGETGPGYKTAGPGYTGTGSLGQPLLGYANYTPAEIFQETTTEGIQRFIGSGNADWRPLSWFSGRADVGIDLTDRAANQLCRVQQCADFSTNRLGFASDSRTNTRNFTANLSGTSSWNPRTSLGLKTTFGAQYANFDLDRLTATGSILTPGAQTASQGTTPSITNSISLSKTLGLFVEEQAAFRDRLFLTGAVRTDQNSAFGTNFQRVYYPKASLSWVISDESFFPSIRFLNSLRLRSSWGASGVQPGQTDALKTLTTVLTSIAGADITGERSNLLGNPNLRPEKSTEYEGGFDSKLFGNRAAFELTYYRKLSKDALIDQVLAPSTGAAVNTVKANLGAVLNTGFEALLNEQIIDRRSVSWDITVNASHNSNKLKSLGFDVNGKPIPPIIGTTTRQLEGYPINGYWQRPYTWSDANGDGIITPNEVTVQSTGGPLCVDATKTIPGQICDGFQFIGYSQPRDELSIVNGIELLGRKLRISALFDYKGGASLLNNEEGFLCQQSTSCPETSSQNMPLWRQARAIAERDASPVTQWSYFEPLNFWRFRELTATYTLPDRIASKFVRAQGASIVFGARNLHVWTKWTGADPEQNYSQGDTQATLLTAGPARYYTFRLNLRY
jgi:TonB-linked SusC/RagA family outer membrane protein